MLLTDFLEENAQKCPRKTALLMRMGYRTVALSYKEVHDLSLQVACFLETNGIQRGDKVLLLAPNSPYWICVFWGVLLRGAILVPLNIQSTPEFLKKVAAQTEAKVLFKYLHFKPELPTGVKTYGIEFIKEEVSRLNCSHFKKTDIQENDLVEIMYTSGTTGDPKGVMLTHKNIYSNVEAVSRVIPISRNDKFLSILPLSHIFEQVAGFIVPFRNGAEIVYAHSPAAIRGLLKEYRITKMAAVPEFLKLLMSRIEAEAAERGKRWLFEKALLVSQKIGIRQLARLLFSSVHRELGGKLRTVASGGAPLDPELEKKWNALGITLLQGYGLTETSPVVSLNTYEYHRVGSVGKVLPGVEVRTATDGEILVKGLNVFQGYFKDAQKTKEVFTRDGPSTHSTDAQGGERSRTTMLGASWFKTGDMGELDKDGFLYLKGRKKYMIKGPGAQNVWPEDIEFELNKIPGVKDSSVVGLEKPGGMVEIHAVLLLDLGLGKDPRVIIEETNLHLASYQQITGWSVWPEEDFPRSATRKVKKEEVLKWLRARSAQPSVASAKEGEKKTPLMHLLAEITGTDARHIYGGTKIVQELHFDSLMRIELVSRCEEKFGVAIEESKIDMSTTIADLEEMIKRGEPRAERPRLRVWPRSWAVSFKRVLDQALLIFPLVSIFVKLRVEGREHLRNLTLPAVFMPNHTSYLDSAVMAMALPLHIRKKVAFAAAQDVTYGTYKHWAWLAELTFNVFPFPRREGEDIRFGLEAIGRLLDRNWSIAVYPEGEMSKTGRFQPLKRGAGLIAVEMDSYIVPVKITGTNTILPYGKLIPRKRGVVTVKFGKPMKFSRRDSYIRATEKIQEALARL